MSPTDRPAPVATLDLWLESFLIAHETIFDDYRRVVVSGGAVGRAHELLAASSDIVVRAVPTLTASARTLAQRWDEERVLTPVEAEKTLHALAIELAEIRPEVRRFQEQLAAIARQLRRLAVSP